MMKLTSRSMIIVLMLSTIVALALLIGSLNSTANSNDIPEELRGLLTKEPVPIGGFELIDQKRQPFNKQRLLGTWTFMFFGYTHCPDVCPTTLTELDNAANQLNELINDKRKIQYVFVSVDPKRDTPEMLGDYVSYFGAKFIAATGSEQELKRLADKLDIKFERGVGTENEYLVNHSSAMLLIDPQARFLARFRAPHYAEEIIDGFKKVLTFSESK